MKKILFVCTGNTCRSPMAEYIMRRLLKQAEIADVKISSAGICVTETKMNVFAREALKKRGVYVRKFLPKQLTTDIALKQSAIICMTERQKNSINLPNVFCAAEFTGADIPDPYGGNLDAYDSTAVFITALCEKILKSLVVCRPDSE